MSAVFATPKDTQASALGMLPSLLQNRPAGKVPVGGKQQEAGDMGLKKEQKGKVQPETLKDVVPLETPPPGLPLTPAAQAKQKEEAAAALTVQTMDATAINSDAQKLEAEEKAAGDSTTSDDGFSDFDGEEDEADAEMRELAAENAEKTADGLPSVGSALHASGQCSRCCFFLKNRCRNGVNCQFCHLEHERRSRGRGCRGRGTSSKEAKALAQAQAAAQAVAQGQQQPPTPQNQALKPPTTPAPQQWPTSMVLEEQRPTLLPPPGLSPPPPGLPPPDAIKPVGLLTTTPTGASCRPAPPSNAPVLSNLPLAKVGPAPSAPPPFSSPRGLPEERGEAPPPPENSPGGTNAAAANGHPADTAGAPALRTPNAATRARVKPAPGLSLTQPEDPLSGVTASQVLLSTSAPPTPAPRLPAVEGCSFASVDGNVTWGQGMPVTPAFRPTAGPVTVAAVANSASAAAAAAASNITSSNRGPGGPILGTTPMPGGAMMPWIPGVPRHLVQPGMLQQPVVMPPRTPTGAPPTPLGAAPAGARMPPPASAPATPAACMGMGMAAALAAAAEELRRPQTDDLFEVAALKSAAYQVEKPLKVSLPEVDCGASPLDPELPAKKRLPEWTLF